ncbi:pyridoxal phosphate-dependent aminotransferase [Nocardia sp. NPDC057227]|uniref:pyridoxal phosphate-dependent aminotransferase n=1 Tax=Nocardia sp. NPDC057227 TaxID=3346056 RepID=UPI0036358766
MDTTSELRTLDLANNELSHGPLPGVRDAVVAELDRIARYPDPMAERLCAEIAARLDISTDRVFAGHGSSAVLEAILRLVARPWSHVVYAAPGFTGYQVLVRAAGASPRPVPGHSGAWQPLDTLATAVGPDTCAVLLTSPHNPSGETVRAAAVADFIDRIPATILVVLDEAYIDFDEYHRDADTLALLAGYPNLVVTRTFSKAHGLAGLRVGYAVGDRALIGRLHATALPYEVGRLAATAAITSLRLPEQLSRRVADVQRARYALITLGRQHGYPVPASYGNFVWLPTPSPHRLVTTLAAHGIAVREFPADGIRITATSASDVAAISHALEHRTSCTSEELL